MEEKLADMKDDHRKSQSCFDDKYREAMSQYAEREAKMITQIEDLKSQNRRLEMERTQIMAEHDKRMAMKSQQIQFSEIQINQLSQSIVDLKKEIKQQEEESICQLSVQESCIDDVKRAIQFSPHEEDYSPNIHDRSLLECEKDRLKDLKEENNMLKEELINIKEKYEMGGFEFFSHQKPNNDQSVFEMEKEYKDKIKEYEFTINTLKRKRSRGIKKSALQSKFKSKEEPYSIKYLVCLF